MVYEQLNTNGYDLLVVNPNMHEIDDKLCYPDLAEIPSYMRNLLIVTHKSQTLSIVKDAVKKGVKKIWIQQHSETEEAIAFANENGISLIIGQCIMMYVNPKGIHKFHRTIKHIFGKLPTQNAD